MREEITYLNGLDLVIYGDPNNNYFIMTKLAGETEHELDYRFRYYSTNTSYEKAR